jgi:catechol 2,3-dioxygenase-like lactoylglutathione lyase family enzyme
MRPTLSRRMFLAVTGGALVAPATSFAASEVPELLDHIILGCNDLDRGIAFVEERTGVRDPDQPDAKDPLALHLRKLSEPQITGWAVHPGDLGSFAKKLRDAGVAFEGPSPGSRKRPDGRVLHWQSLTLKDNPSWLLPFFIEWSADSLHPSADAPAEPDNLAKTAALLFLDLPVIKGEKPQLRTIITGPRGELSATS